MIGRRILILAPHPDDEVVGAAAAISRARSAEARLWVCWLTTGVPARTLLWPWQRAGHPARVTRRRAEAAAAAALLGLDVAGFQDWPTRTLKDHLPEARAVIAAAIDRLAIDRLWVPAFEGGHQDHDAANCLASTFRGRVAVWEFAEYGLFGRRIRRNQFPRPSGGEQVLRLTAGEAALKARALAIYRSEAGNLGHIGQAQECFRPLAACDYARPPHPGPLFYQRFQWLPFRHPRVDATRPDQVAVALAAFLSSRDR